MSSLVGLLVSGAVAFQANLAPEVLLLSRVKQQAARDLSRLPSFTCLATFDRSQRTALEKKFVHLDAVRAEIAYVGGRELFAWPGSNKFEGSTTLAQIVRNGFIGDAEFVSHARTVLLLGTGTIQYGAEEEYAGRPAVRYAFHVSPLYSGFRIDVSDGSATIGIKGSFRVDRDSLELLRLTVVGDEIPAHLGIRSLET